MIDINAERRKYVLLVGGDKERIEAAFDYGVSCGRLLETQIELAKVERQIELVNRSQGECS